MEDKNPNDDLPFEFRRRPVNDNEREASWRAIEATLSGKALPAGGRVRSIRWGKAFAVAACFFLVGVGFWYIGTRTGHAEIVEFRTGYGEIKNITLPDGTVVVLNANSSVRIPQRGPEKESRQVWLEGEAWFQVSKTPPGGTQFVVHTRQVDVEVLGTKFNVNTRRARSIVSLEEGKVRLSVHGETSRIMEKKATLILRPGQVAMIADTSLVKEDKDKNVANLSGWTRHEFHFDNTRFRDICQLIEDTYGYETHVDDTTLLNEHISGDVRISNVQDLLKVLEVSSGYGIKIKDKTIYITAH